MSYLDYYRHVLTQNLRHQRHTQRIQNDRERKRESVDVHIIIDSKMFDSFDIPVCPLWFYKFAHISIFTFSMIHKWFGRRITASSLLRSYYTECYFIHLSHLSFFQIDHRLSSLSTSQHLSIINSFSWVAHFRNPSGDFTKTDVFNIHIHNLLVDLNCSDNENRWQIN